MALETFGFEAKMYQGAAGASAATELDIVRDVTLTLESTEGETTTRATGGFKTYAAGLKDATVEFNMKWDPSNAGFKAIRDAYVGRTMVALKILDKANGEGLDADFVITKFTRAENLDEKVEVAVTARPAMDTRAPAWVEATP